MTCKADIKTLCLICLVLFIPVVITALKGHPITAFLMLAVIVWLFIRFRSVEYLLYPHCLYIKSGNFISTHLYINLDNTLRLTKIKLPLHCEVCLIKDLTARAVIINKDISREITQKNKGFV